MFKIALTSVLLCFSVLSNNSFWAVADDPQPRIQIALLLDTSNSMDGLIDQAKAQLWKMVNLLAFSKKNGKEAKVEIALYHYGNDGLSAANGHIKQVVPMGSDLDMISEKLFELRTNGGEEYCGWAMKTSLDSIAWTNSPGDLRFIIIAGNEPFTQGKVNPKPVCEEAGRRYITVNTIYCGDYQEGIRTGWRDCALATNGQYMHINTNAKVVHISTPYDGRIDSLNRQLNGTYIGYGTDADGKKDNMEKQDANASAYGSGNARQRAKSKMASSYDNSSWDLVDRQRMDSTFVVEAKEEELPPVLRDMKPEARKWLVDSLSNVRSNIHKEIRMWSDSADAFAAKERLKQSGSAASSLDEVMLKAIREQAEAKGYQFEQ